MSPVFPKSTRTREDELYGALDQICEKAVCLAIMFRASKTEYMWVDIPMGTRVDESEDAEMELVGTESGKGGSNVNFNVFGALIKVRKFVPPNEVSRSVLEKAHVVCGL